MKPILAWTRSSRGTAAAEMALVLPFLLVLLFGSVELGNYILNEHEVVKSVRDGARFGSRLTLADTYACPGTVFKATDATTQIVNVTKTGTPNGTGSARLPAAYWGTACTSGVPAVDVSIRCMDKDTYPGIWRGLGDDIPVVKVSADIQYESVFGMLGFNALNLCLRADSEVPVVGI
nr:TadE/TadG family type IV pilus assembly protein [uncultured Sphingomonas sp.]